MAAAVANPVSVAFFQGLRQARRRILVLDYDGILSYAKKNRLSDDNIPQLLKSISSQPKTRLVLLTARPAHEVRRTLHFEGQVEVWGLGGLERLYPNGLCHACEVSDTTLDALAEAERRVIELGLEQMMEVAPEGFEVRWGKTDVASSRELRGMLRSALLPLAKAAELVLAETDEGIDLRLPRPNKSDALRMMLSKIHSSEYLAYVGSDLDGLSFENEEAFGVLQGRGLPVLVTPKYRNTAAELCFEQPKGLAQFLEAWVTNCGVER